MEDINEIYERFVTLFNKMVTDKISGSIGDYIDNSLSDFKKILNDVVAYKMEALDQELFTNTVIKEKYVARGIREKTIVCESGFVTYKRHYFTERESGKGCFLTDECVGLAKGERVETNLALKLIRDATRQSYGMVSKKYDDLITRQTVCNKIKKIREIPNVQRAKNYDVSQLHIETDEDHVAMHSGHNAIVKLAVIHEGRKWHANGRCDLLNKYVLTSFDERNDVFWERIEAKVRELYGERGNLNVNVHGDGAYWIKSGLDYFDRRRFILDKYHLLQRIKHVTVYRNSDYHKIINLISCNDFDSFRKYLTLLLKRGFKYNYVNDLYVYCKNNWFGAVNCLSGGKEYGRSCAEGLVSHILSSRLSSRPMPWGANLKTMSQLLALFQNGGDIAPENIGVNTRRICDIIECAQFVA